MRHIRTRFANPRLLAMIAGFLFLSLPLVAGGQSLDFSCHLPNDTIVQLCGPGEVHIPIPSDGTCEKLWGPGQLLNNEWVYFVDHRIRTCVAVRCLDVTGAVVCTDTFCVLVEVGLPPVCQAPEDQTIVQCAPEEVTIPLTPTDLTCLVVGGPGEILNGAWVYTPTGDETVNVTLRCYNECEEWCEDNFTVTFVTNAPPECNLRPIGPPPQDCEQTMLGYFVEPIDPDGDQVHCAIISGPGTLTESAWFYEGVPGESFTVVIRCYDEPCGDSCESVISHTFPQCQPPTCLVPNDTAIGQCEPTPVSLPVISNGECGILLGPGELIDGFWTFTPTQSGVVCVTIQCVAQNGETCQDEFCVTFEVNEPPSITCPDGENIITEGDVFETDIVVTDPDDTDLNLSIWKITKNGISATPTNMPAFDADGHFTWDSDSDVGTWCFYLKARDECGYDKCSFCVKVDPGDREEYCTLTQGFYGNCGGTFQGESAKELIKRLITPSDPLVIGKPGRSVTFRDGAECCIIDRLPANGNPAALPSNIGDGLINAWFCNTWPALPLKNGRFENVLLGQTIALSLNVRLDLNLGTLGLCESMTSVRQFHEITVYIPSEVLRALDNLGYGRTVEGLLKLANRALGGGSRGGATLCQINDAVDAINRLFDECRTLTECGRKYCRPGIDDGHDWMAKASVENDLQTTVMQNSPNPFNASTQITFTLGQPTEIDLSVYNVLGQKVITLDRGYTEEGTHIVVWDGRDSHGQIVATGVYFYRFIAGDVVESRKMLLVK